MLEMKLSLPKKAKKKKQTLITRDEYAQIARLMVDIIILRTRGYGISTTGEAFVPYSPSTAAKKKGITDADAPWAELQSTLDKLVARLERMTEGEEAKAALRRSISHFRWEIVQERKAFGEKLVRETKVDLTDRRHAASLGREPMLEMFDMSSTTQKARIYNRNGIARLFAKGTNIRKRKGDNSGLTGSMPARPFIGLTDAEEEWIMRDFVQPLIDFLGLEFARLFSEKVADDVRPSAGVLFRRAWQKKPSSQEERR